MSVPVHAAAQRFVPGPAGGGRPAFSLIELMVAIVILGLGLVLVAAIFPAAWMRARTLSETAVKASIVDGAQATVDLLLSVDGPDSETGSFAGDLVFDEGPPARVMMVSDTRVHLLHMENLLVGASDAPRRFVPDRSVPWCDDDPSTQLVERPPPWALERTRLFPNAGGGFTDACDECGGVNPPAYCSATFLSPQVRFEQRVHPPMRARENVTLTGKFDGEDAQWDATLSARHYAWALLHRLTEVIGPEEGSAPAKAVQDAEEALPTCREFDIYHVMLRRPQATLRYARQAWSTAPDPFAPGVPVVPAALPAEEDVVLPEPWRVQVWVDPGEDPWDPPDVPTGIPTEIQVPPPGLPDETDDDARVMLAQMFQRGARFIDEDLGHVYRVIGHRLAIPGGAGATDVASAFLTLDAELTRDKVDSNKNDIADPEERLRTVWVFPPPVEAPRASELSGGATVPVFEGPQPVVAIEIHHAVRCCPDTGCVYEE